jgi:hypothetical protein
MHIFSILYLNFNSMYSINYNIVMYKKIYIGDKQIRYKIIYRIVRCTVAGE